MTRSLLLSAAVLLIAVSCTPESPDPLALVQRPQAVDPEPDFPGFYLASNYSECTAPTPEAPDEDQDGLTEICEQMLADAFAPELFYRYGDDIRREPRWAVRPTGDGRVFILYLLSYFVDTGDPVHHYDGHYGDSEVIGITVRYEPAPHHWVLDDVTYSEHETYAYAPLWQQNIEFPNGHLGTYPRAWVAEGKHASYLSQTDCDNGGTLGSDRCIYNHFSARVETHLVDESSGNIGSVTVPFANCVISFTYGANGREECYWTGEDFRGWAPLSLGQGSASGYMARLQHFSFIPLPPPPPFGVDITGATMMGPDDVCWWTATASNGTPPYSYDWGSFQETTSGSSMISGSGPVYLFLTVYDADGQMVQGYHQASVEEGMSGCH